jgi:hypothetical protein
MKKICVTFVIFQLFVLFAYSQGEIDTQKKVFFRNEKSVGFLLNSNGWGGNYRFGKRINAFKKYLYEVDFVGFKNPKEIKLSNSYNPTGKSYVFGKKNCCFDLRLGYGLQKEIFSKADKGGIAVRYFYTAGPSLAILKPIYYQVFYANSYSVDDEKFSSSITSPSDILGRASFFEGIKETQVIPGFFMKFGFNFEYSQEDRIIHALEAGCIAESFVKELPIMATVKNDQFFFMLFVSYRFGKIVDPTEHKKIFAKDNEW